MKRLALFVLLCASALSGCATARLYPVQGPLSQQNPLPVYIAKLSGALNSGSFKVTLRNGELGQGRWSVVPRPNKSSDPGSSAPPSSGDMAAEWDTVYGPGFYTAHVLGAKLHAKAAITGNQGTVLHVEMYKPDNAGGRAEEQSAANIKGVAKDDRGNIYKVAF
jgi:hypothetical protein